MFCYCLKRGAYFSGSLYTLQILRSTRFVNPHVQNLDNIFMNVSKLCSKRVRFEVQKIFMLKPSFNVDFRDIFVTFTSVLYLCSLQIVVYGISKCKLCVFTSDTIEGKLYCPLFRLVVRRAFFCFLLLLFTSQCENYVPMKSILVYNNY